jgi:transposase InsO family protein
MSKSPSTSEVFVSHVNARLTVHARMLLVERVLAGRPVSHVAKELGVSRQCAHRWVARYEAEGVEGLRDRSSRPLSCPSRTSPARERAVLAERRRSRRGPAWIAVRTGVPARTVSRILVRHHIAALDDCDPVTGIVIRASRASTRRYERQRPGELIHMDVKKIGRIPDGGGWKAHGKKMGRTNQQRMARIGFDYVHSAVDDHSRIAYSEILTDEKGDTCAAFLLRAAAAFAAHGITSIEEVITDNHMSYRNTRAMKDAIQTLDAKHRFIQPHCPWQNGKVERFNRTLQTEWAYSQIFTSNTARTRAFARWLDFYNNQRPHTALGGYAPASRALSPTS